MPYRADAKDWFQEPSFRIGIRAAGPMSGFHPEGVDAEFFPDGRYRSLLVVNIGVPGPDACWVCPCCCSMFRRGKFPTIRVTATV